MRKTVFLLAALAAIISCSGTDEMESTTKQATLKTCTGLDNFPSTGTAEDQAEWLRDYGNNVCEEVLFEKVEAQHNLSQATIEVLPGDALVKQWSDIQTLIGTSGMYDKYIAFSVVNGDIIDLELISTFTQTRPCFSIALFRSIAQINLLKGTDTFTFKNAKVNGDTTIMFEVIDNKSNTLSMFDFSKWPT